MFDKFVEGNLSKRGILYISATCQLKCRFCVFLHQINKDPDPILKKIKITLLYLRDRFKLTHVDLAGAEPTLNKNIKEILGFCNDIGLKPAMVTNGQLTEIISGLIPELDDLIVSIHNTGEDYEYATQIKGSWKRLENTLKMLKEKNFRFRANCATTKLNLNHLKKVVDVVAKYNGRILDFLVYCPQLTKDTHSFMSKFPSTNHLDSAFQPTYTEASKKIKEAIDYSKKYPELTINVRWIPLCMMKGYEKYVLNWHQWIYNPYSWDEAAGSNLDLITKEDYENWIDLKMEANYKKENCLKCRNRNICDGIHPEYIKMFGAEEFKPVSGELIEDAMFYRKLNGGTK